MCGCSLVFSCLAWGNKALGSTGSMVELMVTSKKLEDLYQGVSSRGCCQCPHPCGEPLLTHTSAGDPLTLAGRSGSVSYGVTAPFPWVLVHTRFCLCPLRVGALIPPGLWKSYNEIPLAFKIIFPEDFQSLCQIPMLGSLTWGLEPTQQWENFYGLTVFQFVSCPCGRYEIWFYHPCAPPTISLWLFFVFGCGVSFSAGFQHPPADGCSTASCDFGALAGGDELMPSTPPL